jgi:hypothetical protein
MTTLKEDMIHKTLPHQLIFFTITSPVVHGTSSRIGELENEKLYVHYTHLMFFKSKVKTSNHPYAYAIRHENISRR